MANQATAKKGEEFRFDDDNNRTTKDEVIFKRIEEQEEEALGKGKNQRTDLKIKAEQDILTGKSNIVDFLEYKAKKLTSDPEKQEALKQEMEKIVRGELRTEEENVNSVAKAAFGDDVTSEEEMAAKEAVEKAKQIVLKNPEDARRYRERKAGEESDSKTSGRKLSDKEKELLGNGKISEKLSAKEEELLQKGLYNRKKELAEKVASRAGIENQEQNIMDRYKDQSPGKVEMSYRHIEMAIGLRRMSPAERKAVLEENSRINSELGRFKKNIPINEISKKGLALDGIGGYFDRNPKSRRFLGSYQEGGSFLVRFKMTFYNLGNVLMGRRMTEDGNGFLSMIGGQSADRFVQNSMGLLLNHDLDSSLGRMFAGMAGKLKSWAGDAALKLVGGVSGPVGLAASKVLGFLKKFFGDAGSKLGMGLKAGVGKAVDKGGSILGKAAMGLGALLASVGFIGTAMASTTISGAVVGGTVGWVAYNQYSATTMISELVTAKKVCDSSDMKYINTAKKPWIPCSDMKQHTEQMRSQILQAGYQTRCAVIEAARYLVFDFPYHVPYHLGGYGEFDMGIDDDWCKGAMDCIGFVRWAYRQGGFAINKQTSTTYWEGGAIVGGVTTKSTGSLFKTNTLNFVPNNCGEIKERVQGGDIVRHKHGEGMHAAMVIGVSDTQLQIAQEGGFGGAGVNTCFIDICTGKGIGENPCGSFDRVSLMDTFFEYYAEGGAIDGYPIRPNSDKIIEFPERD